MPGPGTTGGAGRQPEGRRPTGAPDRAEVEALIEPAAALVADSGLDRRQVRAVLPHILSDVPVAILLVDVRSAQVVFANRAAVRMAGDVQLPVPLAEWGWASQLTDAAGRRLDDVSDLLGRVVSSSTGSTGEAVRLAPSPDPASPDPASPDPASPDPASPGPGGRAAAGGRPALGRLMWVTGIPLTDAGDEHPLALLVFLEVRTPPGAGHDPELEMAAIRDRAIIATDLSFTISDPAREDNPLVWVNPAFTRMTGYDAEEIVGANCRFLQGPGTDPAAVEVLRRAIAAAEPVVLTLLNYRKDGSAFWNQLAVSPVFDGDDNLVSFVGVQSDVSERVRVDNDRELALEAERSARRDMERTRGHMTLLAEATTQLSSTLDTTESLERLADLVVPSLADWVVINLVDDGKGAASRVVVRHRQGRQRLLDRYVELQPHAFEYSTSFIPRLLAGAEPVLIEQYSDDDVRHINPSEMRDVVQELGIASAIYVPLVARQRRVLGTMVLASGPSGRRFTTEDLDVAADLGRRAGISIDNARLYEQEHRVAEILQRSLLPAIPSVPGVSVSAEYLPANSVADVGGDFYEILALPDGSVGVAVGDVVGHDLAAAAAMGHLRGLLRACAWDDASHEAYANPERVLERVDRLVQGLDVVPLATLFYARLVRTDGSWTLTYSSAGHPAPVLRLPDGSVEVLRGAGGLLLGVASSADRRTTGLQVPPGSTLVGYTDGLVERRGEDIDDGIDRLARIVGDTDPSDLDGLVAEVVDRLGGDRDDDLAVIAVRIDG